MFNLEKWIFNIHISDKEKIHLLTWQIKKVF